MHELGSVNCLQMYLTRHIPGLIIPPYWSRLNKTFWIDDYKDSFPDSLGKPNSKKWEFWSEFFEEVLTKLWIELLKNGKLQFFLLTCYDNCKHLCTMQTPPYVYAVVSLLFLSCKGKTLSSTNFHFLSLFWPLKVIETHF